MCCVTWRRSMVEIAAAIQVPGFQTRYVKVVLLLTKFIARYPPKIWDFAFINTDIHRSKPYVQLQKRQKDSF